MEQNLTMLNFVVSLNFDNPLGFITSLQTEVDNQMYLKRLPIACSLSLKTASNKEDVDYDSNWKLGQHEYLIYCNNHKKIIARLYSFKTKDKQCFWYYIPRSKKTIVLI